MSGVQERPATRALRVVIADDHPQYRECLADQLRCYGIEVVGLASSGESALEAVAQTAPDVVIMDLRMPGMSGLSATRRLAELAPASRVLVLSASAAQSDLSDAILAGASGYVLKDVPVEEVVERIRAAAAGRPLISAPAARVLLRHMQPASDRRARSGPIASPREIEVLSLLAKGWTDREIAEAACISPQTVREHISNLLRKLWMDSSRPPS